MCRTHISSLAAFLLVAAAQAELTITQTIGGAFLDISTVAPPLDLGDDGVTFVWPGFDLGQTLFTGGDGRVWVSNNGAIAFTVDGEPGATPFNTQIPSTGLFGGGHATPQAMAILWDDLDSDTGAVFAATVGDPPERVFVVQWQDRPHYPGDAVLDGDEATFQVQVFENASPGHAQFVYVDVDFQDPAWDGGASATIGYQADGHQNDVQWSYNQPDAVADGTVLTLVEIVSCPWDLDNDGDIDLADLATLLAVYLACDGDPNYLPDADFDSSGCIELADLAALLAVYGGPCP